MGRSTIPSTEFSTREFEVWRETISVVFDVQHTSTGGVATFHADFEAFQLGDMVVTNARLGQQRYVRKAAQARRDGIDHLVLNLYRAGGWQAQTARGEFSGQAGQVSILDLSCDLVSDEPCSDLVTLFVPRSMLEGELPNISALHGSAPIGPHARLLAEYIDMLARHLTTMPDGNQHALSRATCEMVAACVEPSLENREAARPGLELVLRRRADRFIDAQISSATLSTDAICIATGVSRRALYRLFEPDGGVQHYIQSRRLERIYAALTDAGDTRRISEIAAEFGFVRSDHFATAFKRRFGHSAKEARETAPRLTYSDPPFATPASGSESSLDRFIRALPT